MDRWPVGRSKRGSARRRLAVIGRAEPVRAPFPDIAAAVEQAEAVGLAAAGGDGTGRPAIGRGGRKRAAPDVAARRAVGLEQVVAPGEALALEAAARRALPFRFGRQAQPGPVAIGLRVVPRDMDDGMIGPVADVRARALGALPAGIGHRQPPRQAAHDLSRRLPQRRRRLQVEDEGRTGLLGVRHVTGRPHEVGELPVGDGGRCDGEGAERHAPRRAFAVARHGIGRVVAHDEAACADRDRAPAQQAARPPPSACEAGRSAAPPRPAAVGRAARGHGRTAYFSQNARVTPWLLHQRDDLLARRARRSASPRPRTAPPCRRRARDAAAARSCSSVRSASMS